MGSVPVIHSAKADAVAYQTEKLSGPKPLTEIPPPGAAGVEPEPPRNPHNYRITKADRLWESYVQTFDPPKNSGYSSREEWEPAIQPNEFLSLGNGGPQNDFLVDAYISWQGLSGASGSPFIKATFKK